MSPITFSANETPMAEHAEVVAHSGKARQNYVTWEDGFYDNSSMTHHAQGYRNGGHDVYHGGAEYHSLGCSDVTYPFLDDSIGA
jgi:hypothetical protein